MLRLGAMAKEMLESSGRHDAVRCVQAFGVMKVVLIYMNHPVQQVAPHRRDHNPEDAEVFFWRTAEHQRKAMYGHIMVNALRFQGSDVYKCIFNFRPLPTDFLF